MRLIVAIISVCFYCSVSLAAPLEEFYILPMGQGNGQLVIYNADQPGHKVGVLYDLGSKSLQLHPKFTQRDKWNLNFIPKQPEKQSISKIIAHMGINGSYNFS